MTKLSPHFSLEELTFSSSAARHGIPNEPSEDALKNLKVLAAHMESARLRLNNDPITVHSAFRSYEVNKLVGGAPTSFHCAGLACDFTCRTFGPDLQVAKALAASTIPFDQIILEYGWVHIGFAKPGATPRHQLLTKKSASSPYEQGLVA